MGVEVENAARSGRAPKCSISPASSSSTCSTASAPTSSAPSSRCGPALRALRRDPPADRRRARAQRIVDLLHMSAYKQYAEPSKRRQGHCVGTRRRYRRHQCIVSVFVALSSDRPGTATGRASDKGRSRRPQYAGRAGKGIYRLPTSRCYIAAYVPVVYGTERIPARARAKCCVVKKNCSVIPAP